MMNVPLHYSMKENFWIYLSCLLFCAAIVHRVWEYEMENSLNLQFVKVNDAYEEQVYESYMSNCIELVESYTRRKNFLVYRDSLAIVKYLIKNNKIDELRELWIGTGVNYLDVKNRVLLNHDSQMYSYANDIIKYFIDSIESVDFFETIVMDVKIVDIDESNLKKAELHLDVYSVLDDNVNVIYISEGEVMKVRYGGAISPAPLNSLSAVLHDEISGNLQTHRFYDLQTN